MTDLLMEYDITHMKKEGIESGIIANHLTQIYKLSIDEAYNLIEGVDVDD